MNGVELLFTPGGVHELRVPDAGRYRTISGYFDAPEKLAAAAAQLDAQGLGRAIVFTGDVSKHLEHSFDDLTRHFALGAQPPQISKHV